jgi:hypothetical protein
MFLWVYLVFFNMLWVFIPLYALYHGFVDMRDAFRVRTMFIQGSMETRQLEKQKKKV